MNIDCGQAIKRRIDRKSDIRWLSPRNVAPCTRDQSIMQSRGFVMDIGNWLVKIYTSERFLQMALAAFIFSGVAGHLVHRFLGQASFGSIVNAVIIMLAIVTAGWIDDRRLILMMTDSTMRISMISAAIATGMLLMFASLKHWLRDYV